MTTGLADLAKMIDEARLGPASVDLIANNQVIQVTLDVDAPRKAETLARWLDLLTVRDMVAGKFRASDDTVRLNLGGFFPTGTPVVVVAPFHEETEAAQVALIYAQIEQQQPLDLVTDLMILDIPALSIRPPWAQLIIGGWKPCENRTWTTNYRGPMLVHAGQKWDTPPAGVAQDLAGLGITPTSPRGYLGVVNLASIHKATACRGPCGDWGEEDEDVFHWVVENPHAFPQPVPGPGSLSLYRKDIPAAALAAARELVRS